MEHSKKLSYRRLGSCFGIEGWDHENFGIEGWGHVYLSMQLGPKFSNNDLILNLAKIV